MTVENHMITQNFRLERSHIHPFTHSSLTSEIRLGCSRLCPLAYGKPLWTKIMQHLRATSSTACVSLWEKIFLISTMKLSSFNLCLLFHILLPCSTVISLAAPILWHPHSPRVLLSYSMKLYLLQAAQAQLPQPHLTGKFLCPFQPGDQGLRHRVAP